MNPQWSKRLCYTLIAFVGMQCAPLQAQGINTLYKAQQHLNNALQQLYKTDAPTPSLAGYALPPTLTPHASGPLSSHLQEALNLTEAYLHSCAQQLQQPSQSNLGKAWQIYTQALLYSGRWNAALLAAHAWQQHIPTDALQALCYQCCAYVGQGNGKLALQLLEGYLRAQPQETGWLQALCTLLKSREYGVSPTASNTFIGALPQECKLLALRTYLYLARQQGREQEVGYWSNLLFNETEQPTERHLLGLQKHFLRDSLTPPPTCADAAYQSLCLYITNPTLLRARHLLSHLTAHSYTWQGYAQEQLRNNLFRQHAWAEWLTVASMDTIYTRQQTHYWEEVNAVRRHLLTIMHYTQEQALNSLPLAQRQHYLHTLPQAYLQPSHALGVTTSSAPAQTTFWQKWGNIPNQDYWPLEYQHTPNQQKLLASNTPPTVSYTNYQQALLLVGRKWLNSGLLPLRQTAQTYLQTANRDL